MTDYCPDCGGPTYANEHLLICEPRGYDEDESRCRMTPFPRMYPGRFAPTHGRMKAVPECANTHGTWTNTPWTRRRSS